MHKLSRVLALVAAATMLSVGLGFAAPLAPRVETVKSPTVTVHFLDIGQGDALLIRTADDKAVMVDAGPPESRGAMIDRMRALGISALDALILTHPHADHIGGAKVLVETFPVKLVLDPGFAHTSSMYASLLEAIEKKAVRYRQPRRGFKVRLGAHAELQFLSPEDPLLAGTRSDPNANSFVIKLSAGDVDVMLTGDAEAETEARVLGTQDIPLQCEVLKVAHHGSEYSTTAAFLDAVHPTAAVISVGAGNRYGHPAPPTLRKLEKAGIAVLRTDTDGEVVLQTDGKSWSLVAAHPGARPASGAGTPSPPITDGGTIDINSASESELTKLPGIGKSKAAAIVAHRAANGPFRSVDELTKVKGIGAKTMEAIRPMVSIGGGAPSGGGAAPGAEARPAEGDAPKVPKAPKASAGGLVDLNTASESELMSLPGIGPAKARAILAFRTQAGRFSSVDQLRSVKGIGEKTMEQLRPLVTVSP